MFNNNATDLKWLQLPTSNSLPLSWLHDRNLGSQVLECSAVVVEGLSIVVDRFLPSSVNGSKSSGRPGGSGTCSSGSTVGIDDWYGFSFDIVHDVGDAWVRLIDLVVYCLQRSMAPLFDAVVVLVQSSYSHQLGPNRVSRKTPRGASRNV
eukprot:3282910-Amphidinium_carterae.2